MARWFALVVLLLPAAVFADGSVAHVAAPVKSAGPRRFDIRPTPHFQVADRLVDAMATYENRVYAQNPHVTLKMTPHGSDVMVDTKILHTTQPDEKARLTHILNFAKSYGFSIHAQSNEPGEDQALREALAPFGADKLVVTPQ